MGRRKGTVGCTCGSICEARRRAGCEKSARPDLYMLTPSWSQAICDSFRSKSIHNKQASNHRRSGWIFIFDGSFVAFLPSLDRSCLADVDV
jgi:hypothetical protein